jgi:hypothetical protein
MKAPPLVRRTQLWLPTWFGWTVLLMVVAASTTAIVRNLYTFLSPNNPVTADVLVVEGWIPEEALLEAMSAFQEGGFRFLLTSGGPIVNWSRYVPFSNHAESAAHFYLSQGIAPEAVIEVPAPASAQDRTFLSAVMIRQWTDKLPEPISAINVYSYGPHARRTRLLYRMAFGPGVRIGIRSASPNGYRPETWWRTSAGAKEVMTETIAWLWTKCCFSVPQRDSLEEKWGGE